MNRSKTIQAVALSLSIGFFGFGCGGEEEKSPTPVVQEKPKPKPKPKAKTISQLTSSLSIDERINFAEDKAPRSEQQRIAILNFFNALLVSDTNIINSMLSFTDQIELDLMLSDEYGSLMDEVSLVELDTGISPEGKTCVMAIYEIGSDYQMQLWYLNETGDNITFDAVATPPDLVELLDGDWIQQYFEYRTELAEIALQPDEDSVYQLVGELKSSEGNKSGGSQPGGPTGPGGPGGPRGPGGPAGPR